MTNEIDTTDSEARQVGHTPGPWSVDVGEDGVFRIKDPRHIAIADVHFILLNSGSGKSEVSANARLIASALDLLAERDALKAQRDELLAACKAAVELADRRLADWPTGRRTDECQAIYDQVSIAIANAEAGQ